MNIYKIWRGNDIGWDTYDSSVVVADNAEYARKIHPNGNAVFKFGEWLDNDNIKRHYEDEWCDPVDVKVELLGVANKTCTEPCVVLSSFNAG